MTPQTDEDIERILKEHQARPPIDIDALCAALGVALADDAELPEGAVARFARAREGWTSAILPQVPLRMRQFARTRHVAMLILLRDALNAPGDGISDDAGLTSADLDDAANSVLDALVVELMLPEDLVRRWHADIRNTRLLAEIFDAPHRSFEVRLSQLGLAD